MLIQENWLLLRNKITGQRQQDHSIEAKMDREQGCQDRTNHRGTTINVPDRLSAMPGWWQAWTGPSRIMNNYGDS